tara:strand:+ start:8173 stop:8430 length:258 start_codon:yes stop_codon:yes gene_type:complete
MDKVYELLDNTKKNVNDHWLISNNHLLQNNDTYFTHLNRSWGYALTLFIGSNKAIIHGLFPCFYMTSTTDLSESLYNELKSDKNN